MKTFFNILQRCANCPIIRYYDDKPFVFQNLDLVFNKNIDKNKNIEIDKKEFIISCYIHNIVTCAYRECGYIMSGTKKILYYIPSFQKIRLFYRIATKKTTFGLHHYIDEILDIYSKAQRTYYAFIRLAHIYRLKKYKTVISDDLSMTPLDINHRNTFILIHDKSKYLFSINDLIKIIETSITLAPNFFQEPKRPTNPYTNLVLNYSTLYNIYFKMKASGRIMSTIFHLYFLSNFDLNHFTLNNEAFLRDTTIQNYVNNTQPSILYNSILAMLKTHPYTKKLVIHEEFPKDLLINIFRPFLYCYYIINYDIRGTQRVSIYKNMLYQKLKGFYKYNKAFGRKINHGKPKFYNKITGWKKYSFVTHHIPFQGIQICENTNNYYYNIDYQNVNDLSDNDESSDDTETTTQGAVIVEPQRQTQTQTQTQVDEEDEDDIDDEEDIDDIIDDISLS